MPISCLRSVRGNSGSGGFMMNGRIKWAVFFLGLFVWGSQTFAGGDFFYGRLEAVVAADRLLADIDGEPVIVRLLGIDAPQLGNRSTPDECYARPAIRFVSQLLRSSSLVVEREVGQDSEVEGEVLGYVLGQPGNRDLTAEIIRTGHARVARGGAFTRRSELLKLERQAQLLGLGLWSACAESQAEESPQQGPLGQRPLSPEAQKLMDDLGRKPTSGTSSRAVTPKPASPSKGGGRTCCKVCRKGKACGNSCISASATCRKGPGCACNG